MSFDVAAEPYDRVMGRFSAQLVRWIVSLGDQLTTELDSGGPWWDQRWADWRPEVRSTGQGVLALLANTVPAQDRPEESLRTLSRAALTSPANVASTTFL